MTQKMVMVVVCAFGLAILDQHAVDRRTRCLRSMQMDDGGRSRFFIGFTVFRGFKKDIPQCFSSGGTIAIVFNHGFVFGLSSSEEIIGSNHIFNGQHRIGDGMLRFRW
ncbi:hypothetical protein AB3X94_09065 [Paraburkholderia sp. BR10923]|uniref:hypothetical protein n=1 Tax=Paraburkholderia sp. BR10923 TaxID=3236992 RepID=UPI0034CFB498